MNSEDNYPVSISGEITPGKSVSAENWFKLAQNMTNLGLFNITFNAFRLTEPFGANLNHIEVEPALTSVNYTNIICRLGRVDNYWPD